MIFDALVIAGTLLALAVIATVLMAGGCCRRGQSRRG